jgi:TolB-like protein
VLIALTFSGLLTGATPKASPVGQKLAAVAVFPVENLSAGPIPADAIRRFLMGALASNGVRVLEPGALDQFFERHRVRYTGGIDTETARALLAETGVQGIVVASIEQVSSTIPPKLALFARLVSIESLPTVVWADDVGLSGDDAPGLLDLGLVNDYGALQKRAFNRLADSLHAYIKTGHTSAPRAASKFRPAMIYRAIALERDRPNSVAVIPFLNLTDRRNAGDILALLFIRHLSVFPQFQVIDTGVVRRQLLDARIIMDGGLSLSDADTVASLVDAEFVLGGRVLRYDGSAASGGDVRVEFSTVLIEKRNRKVVWSSDSHNDARDGVGLFERGTSKTPHAMATQMVRLTAASMAGPGR